jgi:hypothetical protein
MDTIKVDLKERLETAYANKKQLERRLSELISQRNAINSELLAVERLLRDYEPLIRLASWGN